MSDKASTTTRNVLFATAAVVSLVLDQWTKVLARTHLKPLGPWGGKTIIRNYFDLRFSENSGA